MRFCKCCLVLMMAFGFMWGCAGPMASQHKESTQNKPMPVPEPHQADVSPGPAEGSLWVDGGGLTEMFINSKARRIGDILTIAIIESSSASNKASTNTGRESELSIGLTSFFNLESQITSDSKFFNPFSPASGSYANSFDGTGSTARSGALTAHITARIVQILPNGNFFIEGNREVRVNNENQVITLTGVVRPRDISADNVIQSTYIADAKINYSGTGVINDEQRPGWLTRILDNIWPF